MHLRVTAEGERGGSDSRTVHAAVTAGACIDGRGAAAAGGAAGSISCQLGRSPTSFTAEGHGGATVTDNEGRRGTRHRRWRGGAWRG